LKFYGFNGILNDHTRLWRANPIKSVKFRKSYFYKKSLENRVGSRLLGVFTEGVIEALKLFSFNATIKRTGG
jgi:hypothetical protein